MALKIIILAAGKGKRMHTTLPKILHQLAGLPLLTHVAKTAEVLHPQKIFVVYGNGGAQVREDLAHLNVHWVEQSESLGTGHAVAQVLPHIQAEDRVLILYADVPLISETTLQLLLQSTSQDALGLLVAKFANPTGFGRIIRNDAKQITAIVEQKDASVEQQAICEINTGIMLSSGEHLAQWLPRLQPQNAQREYYLTDIVKMAAQAGLRVTGITARSSEEVRGVNDLMELSQLERIYQRRVTDQLMQDGVTFLDPARVAVRAELAVGHDVVIDVNVTFEGKISIGACTSIGPNVWLRNVVIGENVTIAANTMIEDAILEDGCTVGPFARIRPGTKIGRSAKVGNFVELKNTCLGEGSKAPHLSYLGDALIGNHVNMGAGTITVNYDGVNKYQTVIKDNVFVGCDSQLIAPVTLGEGAYIGAGSTITKDAPAHKLSIARAKQTCIENWSRKRKKTKATE